MNDFPVYNGVVPSWADMSCKISGTDIVLFDTRDISAFNTGRAVEVGEQKTPQGEVIGTTTGAPTQTCSLTFYRLGFQRFMRTLMANAPTNGNLARVSLVHWQVDFLHTPPNSVEIYHRRVKGCRLISDDMNGAEGTDPDKVDLGVHCKKICDVIDGREVVLL